jgi:hypothetical protein
VWSRAKATIMKETGMLTLKGSKLALPSVIKQLVARPNMMSRCGRGFRPSSFNNRSRRADGACARRRT